MVKQGTSVSLIGLYMPTNVYLLRAPTLSARTFRRLSASLAGEGASSDSRLQAEQDWTHNLLLDLGNNPRIELALAIASPSLHKRLVRVRQGTVSPQRARKAFSSLLRYLIRMSTRPTPFGLFSGVALGSFAEKTSGQLGKPTLARWRTRPDMSWVLTVLQSLEVLPAFIAQLSLRANQLAYIAGDRVYLPPADPYGQRQDKMISLRATPAVRQALELAGTPTPHPALRDALLQTFPSATSEQIELLLWQLWKQGMLLSTLHPPLTTVHPVQYLSQQLEPLQGTENVRDLISEVSALCADLDTPHRSSGVSQSLTTLAQLATIQHLLTPRESRQPHIQVDSVLSVDAPTLPASIGAAAAHAAELLLRLTPFPKGSPSLNDYRRQFLEKYGPNADVPLLELLSPELGLDAPPGYTQPPRTALPHTSPPCPYIETRERILHQLVQEALNTHNLEVVLHNEHLAMLETWHPDRASAPRSLEVYLQIQASSYEDLNQGQFCAVVGPNPGSFGAGRSFGRFADLFDERGVRALHDLLQREETLEPDIVFAELSYQHRAARASNVAIRPLLRRYEIAVGTTPSMSPEHVIPLQDLVVGVHHDRFTLYSLRLNKRVIVSQLHMLNRTQAPNVCRFLLDIASDGLPVLASFDWGSLSSASFLPRVTVQSTPDASVVLSPARWHLQPNTLQPQGSGSLETRRFAGLQAWRIHWRVPRYVYLTQADHRLLLDLKHPLMAAELFAELDKLQAGQQVVLQELLPDFEHLWLTDSHGASFFSEVVVPLIRRDSYETQPSTAYQVPSFTHQQPTFVQVDLSHSHVVTQQTRVFFPGDAWNYVKLYCTPAQQDEIIAGPLREIIHLLHEQQIIDCWFFLRYADPQPHLRLRVHSGTSEQIQPDLTLLLSWGRQLATQGLIQRFTLDTYEREVARYGGPIAISLLEEVFCIDSDLCSNLVAALYTHRLTLDPLLVAVVSLDRFLAAWGYDSTKRLQWLRLRVERYAFRKEFHAARQLYNVLLAPSWKKDINTELLAQRDLLAELLAPLKHQLPDLATQVRGLAQKNQLWVTEDELLASLTHLHKVRLWDLDHKKEEQVYAFWHHGLESIHQRENLP